MVEARKGSKRLIDSLIRLEALDRRGPTLNALPLINPDLLEQSGSSGPLAGRVYTVKDSYAVKGMPLSAGSPAFAAIEAKADSSVVEKLRSSGALLLGKTNMPPVAIGGGQPGLYGRTRSPFNPLWLAAAWHSGSSIGSAVSVAAGFCDFGIGEETVSSGRSPASNNALCAYTPSWGVISSAGNLPLHPFRDTVVPHTPDIASMRLVLSSIVGSDERDIWYRQNAVDVKPAEAVIEALRDGAIVNATGKLRLGVPFRYLGESDVPIRKSIKKLWDQCEMLLSEAGIELVRVPFPLVDAYESSEDESRSGLSNYISNNWTQFELGPLMTWGWTNFLASFGDGTSLSKLASPAIRPVAPWSTDLSPRFQSSLGRDAFDFEQILQGPSPSDEDVFSRARPAVQGFNLARIDLHDNWLQHEGLDGLIFPANGDIGPWDADKNETAAQLAWKDGSVFSNGNHAIRRMGIPSVTIPMGTIDDIGMPVGMTIVGRGWDDLKLLSIASTLESLLPARPVPVFDPDLPDPLAFEPIDPDFGNLDSIALQIKASFVGSNEEYSVNIETGDRPLSENALERLHAQRNQEGYTAAPMSAWDQLLPPMVIETDYDQKNAAALGFTEVELRYEGP